MKGWPWWMGVTGLFLLAALTGRDLLVILAIILALAGLSSEIWYRYCLSSLTYRHELGQSYLAFGETTTLTVTYTNAKPLPLAWLVVRDRFPSQLQIPTAELRSGPPDQPSWLVSVLALRWYERVRRVHTIRGSHRGLFQIGPAELASGDVFGTRRREAAGPDRVSLMVYPATVPLEDLGIAPHHPLGDALSQRKLIEDPLRFAMVRDYVRGDNPRHIHWKATARTGALQTKVFEATDSRHLVLALDVQTRDATYGSVPEYLELLACSASSIAREALEQQSMVGLATNNTTAQGGGWLYMPPGRHPEQFSRIQRHLASLTTFRVLPFDRMIYELQTELSFGSTVLALTARPTEELLIALSELEDNGHTVMVLSVSDDPPELPAQFPHHHLGGRDAWRKIETTALQ